MAPIHLTALTRRALLPKPQLLQRTRFAAPVTTRPFSLTTYRAKTESTDNPNPQRAAQQDREKMDTQANEYSKSGTDSATAGQEDAAFNPNQSNDPEDSKKIAAEGNEESPLDASPANPELSQHTSEESGGAGKKGSEGGGGRQGGGDSTGDKTAGSSV